MRFRCDGALPRQSHRVCVCCSAIIGTTDFFSLSLAFSLRCLCSCGQEEPTYSALWGDNKAFDEVIISPAMLNEHMPHMVMEGLNKVCLFLFRFVLFSSPCVHARVGWILECWCDGFVWKKKKIMVGVLHQARLKKKSEFVNKHFW